MNPYLYRGPLTIVNDQALSPGDRLDLSPEDPLTLAWLDLGYIEPAPKKKGGA